MELSLAELTTEGIRFRLVAVAAGADRPQPSQFV